jgi:hypothetical protein
VSLKFEDIALDERDGSNCGICIMDFEAQNDNDTEL